MLRGGGEYNVRGEVFLKGVGAVRGWGYSFVACLSHVTIDHASLSRRSTVPTPNRHLQHLGAHYASSIYCMETVCLSSLRPVWPSAATIYLLVWRPFSLYHLVYHTLPCHASNFLISSSNVSRPSLYISHSPTMQILTLYCCATRAHICSHVLLLTTGKSLSSFW